ncbi:MAG: asparagine synthase (glutamine-hydrolyzing) [Bacteroidetes bacterium]|nr:asparagine synthase (glutamine-hydrolyzing) [Bacteroidota bacterium]
MCGIVGVMSFSLPPDMEKLENSAAKLIHRGPDDYGIWCDAILGVAHRRLSIIDLSGGHQPMENSINTLVTIFNGEIYNYKELRLTLEQCGHKFVTSSDTEVILHGYEEWQETCFEKFKGMFAICIYDRILEKMILARDIFGEKPIYLYENEKQIFFSSELKPLLTIIETQPKPDLQAIALYLRLGYIPAPYTFYHNISKLPAGQLLIKTRNGKLYKDYKKNVLPLEEGRSFLHDELVDELESSLVSATRMMLRADVPVGVFLSGGLDSSLIAAIIAQHYGPPETFSISFNTKTFDESQHAEAAAQHIGSNHTTHNVDLESISDCLDIYGSFDEPFADPSAIPTYFLAKETRKRVTVALSGDGADELFGGYRRYLAQKYVPYYLKIPKFLRKPVIEFPLNCFEDSGIYFADSVIKSAQLFVNRVNNCDTGSNLLYHRVLSYKQLTSLFPEISFDIKQSQDFLKVTRSHQNCCEELMGFDQQFYLTDNILVKVDRMSMQHSLEVRAPFLDIDVAKVALKTPIGLKIKGDQQKYILKQVASRYLPHGIVYRKKHGFSVPICQWFRNMNREKLLSLMPVGCHQETVGVVIDQHLSGNFDNSQQLLALAVLGRYWS